MLLRFSFENFGSFRDRYDLNFSYEGSDRTVEVPASPRPVQVLNAMGIFGGNASGKTTVLRALSTMSRIVSGYMRGDLTRTPFLLDSNSKDRPTLFEVELVLDGDRFVYGFSYMGDKILSEWLLDYPSTILRARRLFTRDVNRSKRFEFPGERFPGERQRLAKGTKDSALFLTMAAENRNAFVQPIVDWFSKMIFINGIDPYSLDRSVAALQKKRFEERLQNLLGHADLGVSAAVRDVELSEEQLKLMKAFADATDAFDLEIPESMPELGFKHKGEEGEVTFTIAAESAGTITWFGLLGPVLEVLDNGGILLIDELDRSLHFRLSSQIIALFEGSPKAQLLFTTHDATLLRSSQLNSGDLDHAQVAFTSKDRRTGMSELYSLMDFSPRERDNVRLGYMSGRYGGVPEISPGEMKRRLLAENASEQNE